MTAAASDPQIVPRPPTSSPALRAGPILNLREVPECDKVSLLLWSGYSHCCDYDDSDHRR